jgi:hypothetical protein
MEPYMANIRTMQEGRIIGELITERPTLVFFWLPRSLSNQMARQAHTRDTVLVKKRESQTLPWWLGKKVG